MTNSKISQLTQAATVDSGDLFPFVDVDDTSTPPAGVGGSDKAITAANLALYGATWAPSDNGLLGANFPFPSANSTGAALTAGTLYLAKLPIRRALTISTIWILQVVSGAGASTGSFAGLYSSSGTLLTGSPDQGTALTTFGDSLTLTTPQALAAGSFVWAALLCNLASSQPQLLGGYGTFNNAFTPNLNLSAAQFLFATNGTGRTSLPGSITPSSNSASAAQGFWCGYS